MGKFYLTTTLPYVNAEPHIGFAMEIVQADFICRYHNLTCDEVIFNFGTDEHGQKIYKTALEQGKDPQSYVDEYAAKFDDLKKFLNLSYTNFIRTTDPHHKKAAQEFWQRCFKNGDIYKKIYKIKYCVGCELEKTDSELVDSKCPIHPNLELEVREEENYFFRWSKYQQPLLDLYQNRSNFVLPDFRLNEIKQFVESGLQDFSISRLKEKMPWGIEVPNDSEHVMYVWFDALINYISTLGWPEDKDNFEAFWPGVQVAGKDNLRQQSAMWQAMLMSAGLPNSKQIIIHGFVLNGGQKMSKSLGNVIHPYDLVKKYGTDATRFLIGKEFNTFEDSDITEDRLRESYNANLANGLGNLVSRVAKLAEKNNISCPNVSLDFYDFVKRDLADFQFSRALEGIWAKISLVDGAISTEEVWKKNQEESRIFIEDYLTSILHIAYNLQPFMPETAEKVLKQFSTEIKSTAPLFPRI